MRTVDVGKPSRRVFPRATGVLRIRIGRVRLGQADAVIGFDGPFGSVWTEFKITFTVIVLSIHRFTMVMNSALLNSVRRADTLEASLFCIGLVIANESVLGQPQGYHKRLD